MSDHVNAVGWDAIDSALSRVYGQMEPRHYAPVLPAMLGGDDPLQGISVYVTEASPSHFHYVTYGFSELYEKNNDDPEVSGFGFELTFRLAGDTTADAPAWPINLLQNIARYVFSSGNAFDERHHMSLNGPIALGEDTGITAIVLIQDTQLGEMHTANGHVKFLQIVGLCTDEYQSIKDGHFDEIVRRVAGLNQLAITDIFRPSILSDPHIAQVIRSAEPVSAQSEVFGTIADWRDESNRLRMRIGATVIDDLRRLFANRLDRGHSVAVYGTRTGIVFQLGDSNGWCNDESLLIVTLTSSVARGLLENVRALRGVYVCDEFSEIEFEVVPIDIKDANGVVLRTIG